MTVSTTVSSINISADRHDEMAAMSQQAAVNEQEKDSSKSMEETDNRAKLPSNDTEEKCNRDDKTPGSDETHTSSRKVTPSKDDDQLAREFYSQMTGGGDIDESRETFLARCKQHREEHNHKFQELQWRLEDRTRERQEYERRRPERERRIEQEKREATRSVAESKREYEAALEQLREVERSCAETEEHSSRRSQENALLVQEFLEYRGRQQRNQEMLVPCEEHELIRPSKRSRM